jgi:ADP-heptose:LPS heptosyltransferase
VLLRALPGLGDLLTAVPAFRAIRRAEPDASIALIGLESTRSLVERFSAYVDELIPLPGFPGLPEVEPDLAAIPPFLTTMQRRRFDMAVNLHGSGFATNPLVALLGPAGAAGFYRPTEWYPGGAGFLPWRDGEPEVRRWLRLCAAAGWPSDDVSLEFPLPDDAVDRTFASYGLGSGGDDRPIVVVHAGASVAERRWPKERFAAVADAVAAAGARVILTGTADEAPIADGVAAAMDHEPLNLAGQTPLDELAAIVAGATLVVGNDTGVAHLADALRTPSVIVHVGSELERWAALDRSIHRAIDGAAPDALPLAMAAATELLRAHHPRASHVAA